MSRTIELMKQEVVELAFALNRIGLLPEIDTIGPLRPPRDTLFPYATLFRSGQQVRLVAERCAASDDIAAGALGAPDRRRDAEVTAGGDCRSGEGCRVQAGKGRGCSRDRIEAVCYRTSKAWGVSAGASSTSRR